MIKHIAFIMDGNRRFAKENNLSKKEGYQLGLDKLIEFVKYQIQYNIKETSYFALSVDNYKKRPIEEKKGVYELIKSFSNNETIRNYFFKNKIKISLKGDIDYIIENEKTNPIIDNYFINNIKKELDEWNNQNKTHNYYVNLCINYDGQDEILYSFKKILNKIKDNKLKKEEITTDTIKQNIFFSNSPSPEIIVRPGNAPRISGFMLWDSKYSEIYLTKKLWPQLTEEDFKSILEWFNNQKRNFGK